MKRSKQTGKALKTSDRGDSAQDDMGLSRAKAVDGAVSNTAACCNQDARGLLEEREGCPKARQPSCKICKRRLPRRASLLELVHIL